MSTTHLYPVCVSLCASLGLIDWRQWLCSTGKTIIYSPWTQHTHTHRKRGITQLVCCQKFICTDNKQPPTLSHQLFKCMRWWIMNHFTIFKCEYFVSFLDDWLSCNIAHQCIALWQPTISGYMLEHIWTQPVGVVESDICSKTVLSYFSDYVVHWCKKQLRHALLSKHI